MKLELFNRFKYLLLCLERTISSEWDKSRLIIFYKTNYSVSVKNYDKDFFNKVCTSIIVIEKRNYYKSYMMRDTSFFSFRTEI